MYKVVLFELDLIDRLDRESTRKNEFELVRLKTGTNQLQNRLN